MNGIDILAYQFRLAHENGSTASVYLKNDIFEEKLLLTVMMLILSFFMVVFLIVWP
ncbi:hypothetical protein [Brevinema andersonii]|uniref:hypothetical protein n=1 Tax=Brevinema andersonii TaxID=34097 RepID=UPI001356364F|nr:hypothetical protein [Brevinema andersonii]